ncbi:hypothetical protein LshimejAT787_0111040 [Lyophyllum shimeji]|uniref:DUF6533 domain-containing protein n=1 Tax=Lyophyllum shimeji TaxID=47721 RepID=A0A9P3PDV9_LYOSH|nr:hypothetical protein LshimejAT787_0111040 [Lyophyllum shimeji]
MQDHHIPSSDAELIFTFFSEFFVTRCAACAGCALVWWEWLITLDDEVTHIWPTKWTATKIIFLVNRYINLLLQPAVAVHFAGFSPTTSAWVCRFYIIAYGSVVFLSLASIHALVVVRTWVVCGQRPWVTAVLVAAYIIYASSCLSLLIYSFAKIEEKHTRSTDGVCISFVDERATVLWIISLGLEYACFALIICNSWLHRKGTDPAFRQLSPIRRKICTAAKFFVLYTSVHYTVDIILWSIYGKRPYNMIAVTLMYCLTNVAGQRFVLDIRKLNVDRRRSLQLPTHRLSLIVLPAVITPVTSPRNLENRASVQ